MEEKIKAVPPSNGPDDREEENRARMYLDLAGVFMMIIEADQTVSLINRKGCEILGRPEKEVIGRNWFDHFIPERLRFEVKKVFEQLIGGDIEPVEFFKNPIVDRHGEERVIAWHNAVLRDRSGKITGTLSSGTDVTDQERAEKKIRNLNCLLRTISDINQLIVREGDRRRLLEETCRIIVEQGGFRMAWVGEADYLTGGVRPAAQAGFDRGYLESLAIRFDDRPPERSPIGTVLRTGVSFVCEDVEREEIFLPWREAAREQGYRGMGAFPLQWSHRIRGSLNIYAGELGQFTDDMVRLLEELADDLSFALQTLEEREARQSAEQALRDSEARFRDLYDNAPDMYLSVAVETGRVIDCNRTLCRLTGFTREEFIGRPVFDLYHPDCQDRVRNNLQQFLNTGVVRDEGLTVLCRDGRTIDVSLNASAVRDDSGRILYSRSIWRDVTRSKEVERNLAVREAKIRSIFRAAPVGIGLVSYPDRILLEVNDLLCRMVGYSPEELIGKNARLLYPSEEEFQRVRRDKYAQIDTRGTGSVETRWQRKDGIVIEVLLSSTPLDDQDYSRGVTFTALDITERLATERALQYLAQKWQATFDAMKDFVCLLDDQARVVQCNRAMKDFLNKSAEELRGKPCWELMHQTSAPREQCPAVLMFRTGRRETLLMEIEGRWFEVTADPIFGAEGKISGAVHIISDRTENKRFELALRESEERFRNIYENAIEGIFQSTSEGKYLRVNPSHARMFGYDSPAEMVSAVTDIGRELYADPEERERIKAILKEKGVVQNYEVRRLKKDQSVFWTSVNMRAVREETGKFLYYEGVTQDITDRIKAESEKASLEQQLRQAQKLEAIGTLAGGIAHDFNNILGAVLGFTELARMDIPEGSHARADLDQVLKAALRAKDLVRQILTFSRRGTETLAAVDILPVIKEALKMLRASLPATIEIRQTLQVREAVVHSDPTQIHQILMNLCTNAAQAMVDTGGVLEVTLSETEPTADPFGEAPSAAPGTFLEIEIRDTGQGIPREILDHIFEPYFTTKQKGLGTGLGLSVVHGIVKQHGGLIRVESEPGRGSRFRVFLPKFKGEPALPEKDDCAWPRGSEHVLVVDDEMVLVEIMKKTLERLGYRVTALTYPQEALNRVAAQPDAFQLVITDMTMPKLPGDRLIEKILEINPRMPVIICTGYSDRLSDDRVRKLGARTLLMKPIEISTLALKVREALDEG